MKKSRERFENPIKKNVYLEKFNFDEVYCYKLDDDYKNSKKNFYIKNKYY